jgi:hypothetical protein
MSEMVLTAIASEGVAGGRTLSGLFSRYIESFFKHFCDSEDSISNEAVLSELSRRTGRYATQQTRSEFLKWSTR